MGLRGGHTPQLKPHHGQVEFTGPLSPWHGEPTTCLTARALSRIWYLLPAQQRDVWEETEVRVRELSRPISKPSQGHPLVLLEGSREGVCVWGGGEQKIERPLGTGEDEIHTFITLKSVQCIGNHTFKKLRH